MDLQKSRNIILLSIIGDALGSTCEGMSRGHIGSLADDGAPYFDPPVKKINAEKWRKPGLYTSITQFLIITSLSLEDGNFHPGTFIQNIRESPKPDGAAYGIFRHPSHAEKLFLDRAFTGREGAGIDQTGSARILPWWSPLPFPEYPGRISSSSPCAS